MPVLSKLLDFSRGYGYMSIPREFVPRRSFYNNQSYGGSNAILSDNVDGLGGMTHNVSIIPLEMLHRYFSDPKQMANNIAVAADMVAEEWLNKNSEMERNNAEPGVVLGTCPVGRIIILESNSVELGSEKSPQSVKVELQLEFNTYLYNLMYMKTKKAGCGELRKPDFSEMKILIKIMSNFGASKPLNKDKLDRRGFVRNGYGFQMTVADFIELLLSPEFQIYIDTCRKIMVKRNRAIEKREAELAETERKEKAEEERRRIAECALAYSQSSGRGRGGRQPNQNKRRPYEGGLDRDCPTGLKKRYNHLKPDYEIPCDVAVQEEQEVFPKLSEEEERRLNDAMEAVLQSGYDLNVEGLDAVDAERRKEDKARLLFSRGIGGGGKGVKRAYEDFEEDEEEFDAADTTKKIKKETIV